MPVVIITGVSCPKHGCLHKIKDGKQFGDSEINVVLDCGCSGTLTITAILEVKK